MPRENIPSSDDRFQVRVAWNQDGTVQVGVAGLEDRSLVWLLFGSTTADLERLGTAIFDLAKDAEGQKMPEQLGRDVLNALDTLPYMGADERILERLSHDSALPAASGYSAVFANLDRKGSNVLVRVLRRARNQAFGADE